METIKNYLETMFQNLPNLPEVQKAKFELGQMMEDKYQELLEEGKSDNEAVAIVISEFGNLQELAEELGIRVVMQKNTIQTKKVSLEEVKEYIANKRKAGYQIALGVLLCIIAPCGNMITNETHAGMGSITAIALVAIAVGLFVFANMSMGKWKFLKQQACSIDFATAEYVHNEMENFRMTRTLMITIGVALCVFSVIPVLIVDDVLRLPYLSSYGESMMFLCVAIGVFLFVSAAQRKNAYMTILKLNARGTMGAQFVPSQKNQIHYTNKTVETVMSVYWQTVLCLYLCWSFLSFDWYKTWLIWPVAGIISKLIGAFYREK